ncbi:MAG: hypothetical protein FWG21_07040 [Oscillospiraceae bacterium]|nr:hypothetical protein [Oscillospiraceae bacterium]
MDKKHIPIEKRSKKAQQDFHKEQRNTWGVINPVTRKPPNPKAYNRNKNRHKVNKDSMSDFLLFDVTSIPDSYL